jgi:sulfite exporter TauE/SafE
MRAADEGNGWRHWLRVHRSYATSLTKGLTKEGGMGLGTSIFLIAVGAILDFAVTVSTPGFNIHTMGLILMVVGVIGLVMSMIFWGSWSGFHRRAVYSDGAVPPRRRRRVIDEEID